MKSLSDRKLVLVIRKSRLDDLITRFNSVAQAKFYIEHLGADFREYEEEHNEYKQAIQTSIETLERFGRVQVLQRSYLPSFLFNKDDIVIALGQDGLIANTLKYITVQPLIGVNPSPLRLDSILLPFGVNDLEKIIPEVIKDSRSFKEVSMAMAKLQDGQILLGVNDLFIGQKTHVSARYHLKYGDQEETQSSSGVIVSTGLGSTGWLKSVFAGAEGLISSFTGHYEEKLNQQFSWDSDYLYFSTREPFQSKTTGTDLTFGKITKRNSLRVISQMPENGVIFSDGIEKDFLGFNSGMEATITLADRKGILIV